MNIRLIPMPLSSADDDQLYKAFMRRFGNRPGAIVIHRCPSLNIPERDMSCDRRRQDNSGFNWCGSLPHLVSGDEVELAQDKGVKEPSHSNRRTLPDWRPVEDSILRAFYPCEGSKVVARLEGRSEDEVIERAAQLQIQFKEELKKAADTLHSSPSLKDGSSAECGRYRCNDTSTSGKPQCHLFPTQSKDSITQAKEMGESSKNPEFISQDKADWSKEEDKILQALLPIHSDFVAAALPRRSAFECVERAKELGIKSLAPWQRGEGIRRAKCFGMELSAPWQKGEDKLIRAFYPKEGIRMAKWLPHRTRAEISWRAFALRVEYLGEGALKKEMDEAATQDTGNTLQQGKKIHERWEKDEDELIRSFYPKEGPCMADRLPDRTVEEICRRACFLGVEY